MASNTSSAITYTNTGYNNPQYSADGKTVIGYSQNQYLGSDGNAYLLENGVYVLEGKYNNSAATYPPSSTSKATSVPSSWQTYHLSKDTFLKGSS
jgi:hypothetical protein